MDPKSPEFKMARAKAALILELPFYATLACNLKWVRDDTIPTMATNGTHVLWSATFVNSISLDEVKFVICHEILHCVFLHMARMGARDHYNWNIATDIVINDMLIKDGIGTMPKIGVHIPQLAIAGKYLAEEVYNLLPPAPPSGKRGGAGGNGQPGPLDELQPMTGSPADQAAAAGAMKVAVAQAAQAAKMQGKLSAGIERFVTDILKPKVNWREVLRNFVSQRAKVSRSYARPNRRFLDQDLYFPSLGGETLGEILVAIDCSGSIGRRQLDEFAAELRAIHEDMRPACVHVVYFDASISHYEKYLPDETLDIKPHGGGGTDYKPIFRYAEDHEIYPIACVVLTDGHCSSFGPPPAYPVLWATTEATTFPWGQVVEVKN